jgi:hypothetical protein
MISQQVSTALTVTPAPTATGVHSQHRRHQDEREGEAEPGLLCAGQSASRRQQANGQERKPEGESRWQVRQVLASWATLEVATVSVADMEAQPGMTIRHSNGIISPPASSQISVLP